MFDYIKGDVTDIREGYLTIENKSGVGFLLNVSENTATDLINDREDVKVYTYMAVRENDVSLFGFSTLFEREIFFKLLTVPKIGPKIALSILSALSPNMIVAAIMNKDYKSLCTANGVGKKAAEQIVVTLQDKFGDLPEIEEITVNDMNINNDLKDEAILGLTSLGFDRAYAAKIVREISVDDDLTIEDILSLALQKVNE
ncbi:Holliday junction branch migration protein RuvA [Anaerofustis stercorihominis]|uniref:Holliday junction branch migration complex subunit RuvA n=2 Tax=Anaerofustis stercorihominis TaxID=214853 RepID=B1C6M7_9FIRM|nr:Holliday junction branch migration protein RuvA [Anaerofustis stercorihominis]EDS72664.1 Holliday junction DNA helicase RuvA [Anaerofustis stercorihominis DSM 17244]MCQ4794040.1 Holliday junction branch migration protein RuvA [Anaerofustis stercorihominis]RGD74658.1 Holliday junction branch migration protein RuvA [Anaerofustis stercorihominis]